MHDSQGPGADTSKSDFRATESHSVVMSACELAEDPDADEGALALELVEAPSAPEPVMLAMAMQGAIGLLHSLVEVYRVIDRVADATCTILISGDSGTGKELARAVHEQSPRSSKAFVAVNCGAIPEALLESELFGHAGGAFTGAHAKKVGLIALAEGGTLFLDEIGEMSMSLQVKLLRVLRAREYSPVGDDRTLKADVRIVVATNVSLENAVQAGAFREDLYWRLRVIHLNVSALGERPEDLRLLVQRLLNKAKERVGRTSTEGISRAAAQILADHQWPGNVREFENTVEHAVLLCQGSMLEPEDLPQRLCGLAAEKRMSPRLPDTGLDLRNAVESFENHLIRQALERTKWNKKRAASLLGLNRTTLVEMLKRKRINPHAA